MKKERKNLIRKEEKMVSEKIKIYVSAELEAIVNKDTESFEFFKSNGVDLNRNALLTRLIVNYSESFHEKQRRMIDYMSARLERQGLKNDSTLKALCFEMSERLQNMHSTFASGKFDRPISIKPTRASAPTIQYIEGYCLYGASLSEHFRNMLASYASLPQDEREKIIFKGELEKILLAIEQKKKIFITMANHRSTLVVSPCRLTSSKEELHVYLLAGSKDGALPIRLSRIASVDILSEDAVITEAEAHIINKMVKYGPQFIYGAYEPQVIVELTHKGVDKFRKLYVHRPVPDKVEGNRYYFSCSYFQLLNYFLRFGEDAYIVEPKKLRLDIIHFFKRAVKKIYARQDADQN